MTSRKVDYSPEAWERHKERERQRYAEKRLDPEWRRRHHEVAYAKVTEYRQRLDALRRARGCIDCGTHEGRLDFDHRPGEVKEFNLGRPRASWARLLAEVAKCDVRCVSCHARRHGEERGGLNG
jgi:hypothetical protein